MVTVAPTGHFRYRSLLSDRAFASLLATAVLARLPLGMNSLAILLFMRSHTGSFLYAGVAVGAYTLASAGAAPILGRLLDRLRHARVLMGCVLAEGALLLALVAAAEAGLDRAPLVALAALAGMAMPPVSASLRSLWPQVVSGPGALETTYALDATTQEVIWTLGPVLVGLSAALASAAATIVLCVAIGLIGTLLFVAMPAVRAQGAMCAQGAERVDRRLPGGAIRSGPLRALLLAAVALGLWIGALQVGLPALAVHLKAPAAAGVLLAVLSFGSMIGGLLYGMRSWHLSLRARHQALLCAVALLSVPLLIVGSLPEAIALSLIAGLACAPVLSCQYSLVQALAPTGSISEAFNWHTASLVAGVAAGTALGGALVEALGVPAALAFSCVTAALGAAWAQLLRVAPETRPERGAT